MGKLIFFFANIMADDYTRGVTKKVFAQIKALENLGYIVSHYTGYIKNGAAVFDRNGQVVLFQPYRCGALNRFERNQTLKIAAERFLSSSRLHFHICYFRYLYFDYYFCKLLKTAKQTSEHVWMEVHSYPVYNKRLYMYYPVYVIDRIFRTAAKKNIDFIISVSEYQNIWGMKTVCIENGIDLSSVVMQDKVLPAGQEIRLIAVGYEWHPHGYDRIIKGLYQYWLTEPRRKVTLTLVGTIMKSTKKLIRSLKMENYVFYKGKKFGRELNELYDYADIGIGALAPQRAGTGVSCGLKTREYMAKGLPFIYAGDCLLSEEEIKYHFQVTEGNEPLDISKIIAFYDSLCQEENYAAKIREFAKKHTWEVQLKKVLDAYEEDYGCD